MRGLGLHAIATLASGALMTVGAAGCLASSYTIPHDELARLALLPAEQRGGAVRVVQRLGSADEPPPPSDGTAIVFDAPVVVAVGVSSSSPSWHAPPPAHSSGGSTGSGGSGGSGNSESSGDSDGGEVVAFAIAAAALGVGLAATEGSRFDGWAEVDANQPVHLIGPNGEVGWVPLSKLDASMVAWADEAIVSANEGRFLELGRAPLDRAGFVFGVDLGTGGANGDRGVGALGFTGRASVGLFPVNEGGILLSMGFRTGDGEHGGNAVEWRPSIELQTYPISTGLLHLGLYGEVGLSAGVEHIDNETDQRLDSPFSGGGVLAQLEVTTRLALTMRGGVAAFWNPGPTNIVPQLTLGIAVY